MPDVNIGPAARGGPIPDVVRAGSNYRPRTNLKVKVLIVSACWAYGDCTERVSES